MTDIGPVDTPARPSHPAPVSEKPHKVGEPKTADATKKPAKAAAVPAKAGAQDAEFKRITDKLLTERKELLHKLAQ